MWEKMFLNKLKQLQKLKKKKPILLVDLGGTYLRFAITRDGKEFSYSVKEKCSSYQSFEDALRFYFQKIGFVPKKAYMAIAGVFKEGRIALSNNPWIIVKDEIKKSFGFQDLFIINDFVGQALSVPCLKEADVICLKGGIPDKSFPLLVMGPGTGLGVSLLIPDKKKGYRPFASEAGHISLSFETKEELALYSFLKEKYPHISVERVISGKGLSLIYEFKSGKCLSPEEVSNLALSGDKKAKEAVLLMMDFLGSAAGNFALAFNAFQGVYFSGGILQHKGMIPFLKESHFMERFIEKGRMREILAEVPIYFIHTSLSAFIGLSTFILGDEDEIL